MPARTEVVPDDVRAHLGAVARGGAASLAGAMVSTIATFGLVVVVSRSVPPDVAGRFFAATALFLMASATAGLGTDTGLARFVLRAGRPTDLRRLLVVVAPPVLAASVILAGVLAIVAPDTRPLVWALPCAVTADLCLGAVRAHASFRSTVLVDRLVRPGVQLGLVATVVATGLPGSALALAWAAAYVVSAVLAAGALRPRLAGAPDGRPLADPGGISGRAFWAFTWPRATARIAQVAIQKLDIVLVAAMLSPVHAAAYTVATRFVVFGQLANQAVSSVVQPRFTMILAREEEHDRAALARVFGTTTCWSVLLAWPVYACVVAAPAAYLGCFGGSYATSENVAVAVVMVLGMLVAVATGPVDTLLLMLGRSGRSLANTLVALAIDVGLCLLLVPRMGIVGASIAWVAAVVVRCLLAVVELRSDVRLRLDLPTLGLAAALPLVCVAAPLMTVDRIVGLGPLSWAAACAVAVAGYLAVVWRCRERLAVDVFIAGLRRSRLRLVVS
jgi:O-antigen/teichoic acid export membrane protein